MTMTTPLNPISENITLKAIQSTKWVILSKASSKVIQSIATIILARLLTPEDFGLVAMAAIAIGIIGLFQDLGIGAALIQRKDNIEDTANVVFITNITLGLFWYSILFGIAPYIAYFFKNDLIIQVLRIAALGLIIGPLTSVQGTLLTKDLNFRKLFYLGLVPLIFSSIFSIVLAFNGFGVWALVYGSLSGSIINVFLVWLLIPWRPTWRYDLKIARKILGFGGYISLENILVWGITTVDNIFVGRFLGAKQLGIYQMGFNMGLWPAIHITGPLGGILYPTFSKLQDNQSECRRLYLRVVRLIVLLSMPIGLIFALCAEQIILLLLGEQWRPAIPVVQILSIVGILASIVSVAPTVYKAMGRVDIMPKFFTVRLIFSLPAYYYASQKGLISLCIAHLILVLIFAPINFYIAIRFLRISLREVIDIFRLPIISSLPMSIVILGIVSSVPLSSNVLENVVTLLFTISIGVLIYFLSLRCFGGNTLLELKKVLRVALT